MGLAAVFPEGPIRILEHGHLAARCRTGGDGRSRVRRSRYRVTWLWCGPVRASIAIGVPIPILSAAGLGSASTSPRAVRMSGLSVAVLRSDFAMLQKQRGKEPSAKLLIGRVNQKNCTSHFGVAPFAFAQVLEQKLCNTPEVGSNHLGLR